MIYCILLLWYFLSSFFDKSTFQSDGKRRKKTLIYLLPMFILVAFRDVSIGADTSTYYRTFLMTQRSETFFSAMRSSRMEPAYVLLNYAFSHLGLSFSLMQICIAAFIYSSIARTVVRYSENISLTCFLFMVTNEMFGTMNVTRMWIALAFLLLSIEFIEKKKPIPFILLIACASVFHYTSLTFAILYPLCTTKPSGFKSAIIIGGSLIAGLFAVRLMTFVTSRLGMYENYLTGRRADTSNNIAIYTSLAINICFLLFIFFQKTARMRPRLGRNYDFDEETVSINYIGYISLLITVGLGFTGLSNTMMSRVRGYFEILRILVIPQALNTFKRKNNRRLFQFVICALLIIEFIYILIYRPGWYSVMPYKFFFISGN